MLCAKEKKCGEPFSSFFITSEPVEDIYMTHCQIRRGQAREVRSDELFKLLRLRFQRPSHRRQEHARHQREQEEATPELSHRHRCRRMQIRSFRRRRGDKFPWVQFDKVLCRVEVGAGGAGKGEQRLDDGEKEVVRRRERVAPVLSERIRKLQLDSL